MQTTYFSRIAVIQSLPEDNLHTGDKLCEDLDILNLAHSLNLDVKLYNVKTKEDFLNELSKLAIEAKTNDLIPILHIDMHGNKAGLEFASGDFITWTELKYPLTELNISTKNNLFITLSSCHGAYLIEILKPHDRAPYCGLVGPINVINAFVSLENYIVFYRELLTTGNGDEAVKHLRNAAHPNEYYFTSAEILYIKVFKKYIKEDCTTQALKKRALKVHEDCKAATNAQIPNRIAITKRKLANTKGDFKKYRKIFFMIDLFPENKERFTLKYKNVIS